MCILSDAFVYYAKADPKKFILCAHPLSISFLFAGTVFFFTWEVFYLLPDLIGTEGWLYKVSWIVSPFLVYNIWANMLACYRTDSSVASLPKDRLVPDPNERHLWHHCEDCEQLVPPRSWHCKFCKCCILKRDHHCIFTANCIGHNNHRYFFWFTFYVTLGTAAALVTNFIYMLKHNNWHHGPAWIFNLYIFISGSNSPLMVYDLNQNVVFSFNVFCVAAAGLMLLSQTIIVYRNASYYQRDGRYDLGVRQNINLLMGEAGLWTFLSPSVKSPLPHDGVQWQLNESFKEKIMDHNIYKTRTTTESN
ncbi:uncharacterized protein Dana_GF19937 [Drosophila ananassae]|uniref:Palmitoyltransferase n=1 Tax=Drosophila ananassae TaxID=7217 RepID=B3LYL8_DROAN|nr:probable palmitoyltransferase ZDHHC24 [Drosophila ananassae]EDV42933.1 uncharacterized protein Dana_GF19937 [Drosophila ananassae]